MKGKRANVLTKKLKSGQYSHHDEDGGLPEGKEWYAVTPNGILTHLGGHDIEQHEDGTITVFEPVGDLATQKSRTLALIQATTEEDGSWRGFLEKGIWRESA